MLRSRVAAGAATVLALLAVALPARAEQPDLDLLADANVRIVGQATGDEAGSAVADAGDVNGDGRDDVIIGAPLADNNGRTSSGSAYVLFGSDVVTDVDLDALAGAGFRIDGAENQDLAGASVAGAGDVNGDGLDDVIVGARTTDNNGRTNSGSAYVIYGSDAPADVDLLALGGAGFRIDGAALVDIAGTSVAGAGDVNDDGRDDVIVGAPGAGNNGRSDSGSAYVVYGSAAPVNVDLAALGTSGFRIDGQAASDLAGTSVARAGDINGDGRDDVVVGASSADNNGRTVSGSAYVIYGVTAADPADVDLAGLSTSGFQIDGAVAGDLAGISVAEAGDVNRDGRDDVAVGALSADNNGRPLSGSAYVIYGTVAADPADIDLAALGTSGFRIDGQAAGDAAGVSVGAAGDVNADGRDDVIVGASSADNNGRNDSGSAYVIYGTAAADPADIDLAALGTSGFRIDGAAAGDRAGVSVSGNFDFDSDGRDDVIVGAVLFGPDDAGAAYVITRDSDSDGVRDDEDNCRRTANADQADNDSDADTGGDLDGGDACDPDDDNDTITDGPDNCDLTANTDQANLDGDAQGDVCDPDDDNDGDPDTHDRCPRVASLNADGCPLFERSITLRYDHGAFRGRISSVQPACVQGQTVALTKLLPGPDRSLGRAVTSANGSYSLERRYSPGRYRARVGRTHIPGVGNCRFAKAVVTLP